MDGTYLDSVNNMIRDQKILRILKENAVITKGDGRWKGIEVIEICVGNQSTDENDFELVKEWLEED